MNLNTTRNTIMAAMALAVSGAASAQTASVDVDIAGFTTVGGRGDAANSSVVITVPPGMTRIARISYSNLTYNTVPLSGSYCNELRMAVEAGSVQGATTNNILAVSPTGAAGAPCDAGFSPAPPGTAASYAPNNNAAFVIPSGVPVRVFVFESFDDQGSDDATVTSGTLTVTFDDGTYSTCSPANPVITNASGSNSLAWRNEAIVPTLTAEQSGCSGVGDVFKANYYKFTPTITGPHTFTTCGTSTVARRLVVLSDCANPASVISCGAATTSTPCGTTTPGWAATASLTAGQAVWVAVGATTSTANLGTTVSVTVTSPYDACVAANLPANTYTGYGTATLTYRGDALVPDMTLAGCGTIFRANAWKYTPSVSGNFTFRTCNGSATAARSLAVLDGCNPATATVLGCGASTATADCPNGGQEVSLDLTENVPVFFVIGGATAATSLGTSASIWITGPTNPDCSLATPVQFGTNTFGNEATGLDQAVRTNAPGNAVVFTTIAKARWYTFRPGATGLYTFSVCGSVNDTKMAIGTQCARLGDWVAIGYNDDTCACTSGCGTAGQSNFSSKLGEGQTTGILLTTTPLTAGQTYYLAIGGFTATTPLVSGNLEITGPPQPSCPADLNDDSVVDGNDLGILLAQWGPCSECSADFNQDGAVDGNDLGILLAAWGACP